MVVLVAGQMGPLLTPGRGCRVKEMQVVGESVVAVNSGPAVEVVAKAK